MKREMDKNKDCNYDLNLLNKHITITNSHQ